MDPVVIVASKRTALGGLNGVFKTVSSPLLGGTVIKDISEKVKDKIDSVYMGCVLSAGIGQSPARQASFAAGLDASVHCVNINKICGSGMMAVMFARNSILAEESEIVVAGGMESMTNAPYLLEKARSGYRFGDGVLVDHMVRDGLLDAYEKCVMGRYAEDVAESYGFSRENQDKYAEQSFLKARKSIEEGLTANEIIPITVKSKKTEMVIDKDEIPFSVDISRIPTLRPAFKENGTVTAASASSISDGAAAMLLMKESKAKELGLTPQVRIVAQSTFSQNPKLFATAPIGAIRDVLRRSVWSIKDVDVFEINEAFAVVPMVAMKEFSIDPEKVNILGGACALGHPLGASGARIITTLINAMNVSGGKRGLATLCVGGGEGVAMTLEKI